MNVNHRLKKLQRVGYDDENVKHPKRQQKFIMDAPFQEGENDNNPNDGTRPSESPNPDELNS